MKQRNAQLAEIMDNSPLEKSPTAEPGIEHDTSWTIGNDLTTIL